MRYYRIFLLHFQQAFVQRERSFVWLLLSIVNPFLLLIFWMGAFQSSMGSIAGWNLSAITSYYLLLIIAASFLVTHRETDIAILDIREGALVSYLLKPFPYFLLHFFGELGWRVMQGSFAVVVFIVISIFFGNLLSFSMSPVTILLSLVIIMLGYLISFTFKFLVGLSAFWVTDFWGVQQLSDVSILVFAGFVMPLSLFPPLLEQIVLLTPFPYMVYYPVIALQGKLYAFQLVQVIVIQLVWISILFLGYRLMWRVGVQKFTGVGQ